MNPFCPLRQDGRKKILTAKVTVLLAVIFALSNDISRNEMLIAGEGFEPPTFGL